MMGPIPGKRRRGCLQKQWLDDFMGWTPLKLRELTGLAEDCTKYRRFFHDKVTYTCQVSTSTLLMMVSSMVCTVGACCGLGVDIGQQRPVDCAA